MVKHDAVSLVNSLLPLVVVAGLGYLAFQLLTPGAQQPASSPGSGFGLPGGYMPPQLVPPQYVQQGVRYTPGANNQLSAGTWTSAMPVIPFVTAGPTTPVAFFPGGNVVSTSRGLTQSEMAKVAMNLTKSGIPNAWWSPQVKEPVVKQTFVAGAPGGSGYRATVRCPGNPQCRPGDTWAYA